MRICLHQIAKNTVYLSHFIRRGILLWSSCYCMGTILLLANFINYPTRKRCFLFFCDKTDNHGYSMQGKHLYLFVHNTKVVCIIFHFQFICGIVKVIQIWWIHHQDLWEHETATSYRALWQFFRANLYIWNKIMDLQLNENVCIWLST